MVKEIKKELRQKYMKIRECLPKEEHAKASDIICRKLEQLKELKKSKNILFFAPKDSEVNLMPLIEKIVSNGEKNIYLPCISDEKGVFHAKKITNLSDLKKNAFGIPEPHNKCETVDPSKIDLVLIPAICIDKKGNRIGFGGGYFDRFLARTSAFKLVVVFSCQIVDKIPTEIHDICVNAVITECGFERF